MMMRRTVGWVTAAIGLFSGSAVLASDLNLDQVLDRLDAASSNLKSLEAEIEVKNWTDLLEEFDQGEFGALSLLKQGGRTYFLRRIERPQVSVLLVDGKEAVLYRPRIKQAVRYPLGRGKEGSSNLFFALMTDRKSLEDNYEVELLGREEVGDVEAYVLRLTPRSAEIRSDFSRLVFWLHPELWLPVRQDIHQVNRDFQRIGFSQIEVNGDVPRSRFRLRLPQDVQVKTLP